MANDPSYEDAFAEFAGADTSAENDAASAAASEADELASANASDEAGNLTGAEADPGPGGAAADARASDAAPVAPASLALDDLLGFVPADKMEAAKALLGTTKDGLHSLASEKGRQAALQRRYQDSRAEIDKSLATIAELNAKLAAAETPAEKREAKADVAAAKDTLAELYPELDDPVTIRVKKLIQEMVPQAAGQQPAAATTSQAPASMDGFHAQAGDPVEASYTAIASAHKDWAEVINGANWSPWIKTLPVGLQKLADSDDPRDAIWLISKHKVDRAEAQVRALASQRGADREVLKNHIPPKGAPVKVTPGASDFEATFNSLVERDENRRRA